VKVLVATDDRALREHADRILQDAGYEVLLARDGVEALAKTKAAMPDMVLLEWTLAGIDGIRLCQRIRQFPDGGAPYLIIMLDATHIDRTGLALAAGADDWIARQSQPNQILARLQVAGHAVQQRAFAGSLARLADGMRFRADGDGLVVDVSAGLAALTSADAAQLLGRGWHQLAVAEDRYALATAWDAAMSTQSACEHTFAVDSPEQGRRTVMLRSRPVHVEGALAGHVAVLEDHTRETDLACAVKRGDERFATLTESLPQTIAYVDAGQTIRSRNRTPGGRSPPASGSTVRQWLGEQAYQDVARQVGIALSGHRVRFDCPPSTATGERQFHYDLVPDRTSGNRIDGFLAIVSDTTEDRRLAQRVLALEAELALRSRLADHLPARIAYLDCDLRLQFFNAAFEADWGLHQDTVPAIGDRLPEPADAEDGAQTTAGIARALAGAPVQLERTRFHDGRHQVIAQRYIPQCGPNGKVLGIFSVAVDISEQHALDACVARQSDLLAGLSRHLSQPCVLIDSTEHIRFHNEAYRLLMSDTAGSIDGAHAALVLGRDHYVQHQAPFLAAMAGVAQQAALLLTRHGVLHDCRITYAPHRDAQGDVAGVWCIVTSMVEQQGESPEREQPPQHDATTGLLSRSACEVSLRQAIARANRSNMLMALVFVELDGFAQVVAALGPKSAEKMLAAVGHRLRGCVTDTDVVARWGEVQFIAILECLELTADADAVAAAMLDKLQIPYRSGSERHLLTASIGVAMLRAGETSGKDLMQRADHALYVAKSSGRNRVRRSA
jgi:diguanylate cyclase (GGDEF)-like protein